MTVLQLAGEIGSAEVDSLVRTLNDLLIEDKTRVVLDFREVRHITLHGVGRLAERARRFRALGGEIKVSGLSPYVANLFKLVGAYSQFDACATEKEALERFGVRNER